MVFGLRPFVALAGGILSVTSPLLGRGRIA